MCFHASMTSADKGMMVAAFDHTNQIKTKTALEYDVKPVALVQADNSRRAPLDMHVSPDEGSYLIPSPSWSFPSTPRCYSACFKMLVLLCLLPPWPKAQNQRAALFCCFVCHSELSPPTILLWVLGVQPSWGICSSET